MARYDIPIDGVNSFQYQQGKLFYDSLNIEDINAYIISYIATLDISSANKKELYKKVKADLRNNIIITSNFDVASYIDGWAEVSDNFINKLAIAYLLTIGFTRKQAKLALKDGAILTKVTAGLYTFQQSKAILESLKARTLIKISNHITPYVVKGVSENIIKKAIDNKLLYRTVLYDKFSNDMNKVYNDIYASYTSLGLWGSHTWVSFNPKDYECQVATGEVVEVGKRFSNGLTSPPVHNNCFCILQPSK